MATLTSDSAAAVNAAAAVRSTHDSLALPDALRVRSLSPGEGAAGQLRGGSRWLR